MFFDGVPRPTWDAVPVEMAKECYDLGEISNDSVYLEDQFGEEPDCFFIHRGDVTVEGALILKDDENTLYVIDGDLTVNGPVKFRNWQRASTRRCTSRARSQWKTCCACRTVSSSSVGHWSSRTCW